MSEFPRPEGINTESVELDRNIELSLSRAEGAVLAEAVQYYKAVLRAQLQRDEAERNSFSNRTETKEGGESYAESIVEKIKMLESVELRAR